MPEPYLTERSYRQYPGRFFEAWKSLPATGPVSEVLGNEPSLADSDHPSIRNAPMP